MDNPIQDGDPELDAQLILLAASNHKIEDLRTLLRTGSANVQDPDTGYTPLHSAIAACEKSLPTSPIKENGHASSISLSNGHSADGEANKIGPAGDLVESNPSNGLSENDDLADLDPEIEAAAETIRLLFQNGAIWNDLDKNNETPGCLARRLGLKSLYDLMVDAGVRAEILLNRLDGYELLRDEDSEEEGEEGEEEGEGVHDPEVSTMESEQRPSATGAPNAEEGRPEAPYPGHIAQTGAGDLTSERYLNSDLAFGPDRILDQDNNSVMMAWETEIMQRTADLLAPATGLRILNIGHGMGIIDDFFQAKSPAIHHIIEAHPTILAQMKKNGWDQKSGVTIHEGKWQDVVPSLIKEGTLFDAIYFDTFAEEYKSLHQFFEDSVIGLLDDGGNWGFFNGLGADRQVCYDVYSKVVVIDLLEAGYDVEWETLKVRDLNRERQWEGVKRPYWRLEDYKLPVCTFIG